MADTDLAIRYRNHPRVERLIETLRDGLEEVSLAYNRSDTPGRPAPGAYLALDVSARSDVIATLTLSQESGRVTAFRDGEFDSVEWAELDQPWRATDGRAGGRARTPARRVL